MYINKYLCTFIHFYFFSCTFRHAYSFSHSLAPESHLFTSVLTRLSSHILSRVGDRPTATILQVQFHFFDFCLIFQSKIFDQNMPLLEGVNIK